METQTTRRALLGGAGLVAATAIVPAIAATRIRPSNTVEAAWAEYWAAMDAMNAATEAESENGDSAVWQRIGAAGRAIEEAPDTGPRVAEIRLWFYLTWVITTQDEWDAIRREDIAWLSEHRNSDEYADRIAVAAIKALRTEARA